MCLRKITRRLKDNNKETDAWKVFQTNPGGSLKFIFTCVHLVYDPVERGKWLQRRPGALVETGTHRSEYAPGFHCYSTEEQAKEMLTRCEALFNYDKFALVKVKLRGVETIGTEEHGTVLVAREMFVPEAA